MKPAYLALLATLFAISACVTVPQDRPANGYSPSIADVQRDLTRLGYDPGPIDGLLGPKTRAAIARFERDQRNAAGENRGAAANAISLDATAP